MVFFNPLSRALAVAGAALAFFGSGCSNASSEKETLPFITGSGLTVSVQVDSSFVRGGRVKVNGIPSQILPTKVVLEVDEGGFAIKQYVIAMALNIIPKAPGSASGVTDATQLVIEQGEPPPARISFDIDGVHGYGTGLINRPRR